MWKPEWQPDNQRSGWHPVWFRRFWGQRRQCGRHNISAPWDTVAAGRRDLWRWRGEWGRWGQCPSHPRGCQWPAWNIWLGPEAPPPFHPALQKAESKQKEVGTWNLGFFYLHPPRKNVSLLQCLLFPSCMYYAPDFFSVGAYMCVHWPQENLLSANENFLFGGLLKVPYSVSIYQFSLSNNITKTFFNKRWSKSHLTNFLWRHQILPLKFYALWKTEFENRPKIKREMTFRVEGSRFSAAGVPDSIHSSRYTSSESIGSCKMFT